MRKTAIALVAAMSLTMGVVSLAVAEEAPSTKSCPVDTTKDASTGKDRTGVQICGNKGSAEVGVSVTGKELEHFAKYPIGQSDASVAKHIGNAVHHFFSKL